MPNDQITAAVKVLSRTVIYPHEAEALDIIRLALEPEEPTLCPFPEADMRDAYQALPARLTPEENQRLIQLFVQNTDVDTLYTTIQEFLAEPSTAPTSPLVQNRSSANVVRWLR
jgi:hypothetical protein